MTDTRFRNIEAVLRLLARRRVCVLVIAVVVASSFASMAHAQRMPTGAIPRPRVARTEAAPTLVATLAAARADSSTSCRKRALADAGMGVMVGALGGAGAGVIVGAGLALARLPSSVDAAPDSVGIRFGRDAAIGAGIGTVVMGAAFTYGSWHSCKVRR